MLSVGSEMYKNGSEGLGRTEKEVIALASVTCPQTKSHPVIHEDLQTSPHSAAVLTIALAALGSYPWDREC